jgi:RecB family exonuclease
VRFLLAAMELPERCTWRDVLAVLNSSYFRPQALGPFTAATVAEAERLIRGGQAVLGREALLESCRRQAQRQGRNEYEDEEEPQHVPADADASPRALALLEALFERIESARREPQTAIDAFELPRAALHSGRDSLIALDLRAIQALRTALGQIPAEWARTPHVLGELLRRIVLPGERSDSAVEVLDALDARSLRFRRVYVLGCGEGQFPRRMGAAPLIRESDRAAWAAHGLELDLREDLAAREMLLFYLTVSRGEDSLTASYPVSDGSGRAAAAGSFLEALLEPLGGLAAAEAAAPWFRRMPAGRFLPHPHPAASVREALSTALAGAATTDGPPFAAELSWCREHVPAALEQAARGLAIAHRRWSEAPLDAWDGRLDDPQLLQDLRRDADERVFSASQLNRYARCPFSYFCETVLGLDPLAEPQRVLEPLKQGLFCHAVLAETFKRLYGSDVQPPAEDLPRLDRRRAETALNAAIEECSRRFAGEGIAYPTLWTIQRDRLAARLRRYLREEISSGPRRRPVAFEQAFGAPSADEQARGLQREALAVSAGQRQIRLRGRIDRIDRVLGPAAEGLVVIDYKAGKPPANKAIKNGRDTQIPLYAAAVQQLYSGEDVLGGRYHTLDPKASHTGLSAADGDADDGSGAVQHLREALAGALAAVASHVDAIAAGRFDALGHEDCPGHCPYRLICRRSPAREQIKTADESEAAS